MLKFDKSTFLSFPFKFILSERLSNSLLGSDVYYFQNTLKAVSILYYVFIELFILLYTYLVISFTWYKEYMIWRISYSKFSDVLPASTCASAMAFFRS